LQRLSDWGSLFFNLQKINKMGNIHPQNEPVGMYEKLKNTPPELLTPKELSEAIKEDIRCVDFLPKEMEDSEGFWVERTGFNSRSFVYVPERRENLHIHDFSEKGKLSQQEMEDVKLVFNAMFFDGKFSALPPERKTELVCLAALQSDPMHLKHVPEKYQTDELILCVLRKDGAMLSAIDEKRRTPEMYMTALENHGRALMYFPPEMITPEVALQAVQQDGTALEFVPGTIKTPEICRVALPPKGNDYEVIEHVPFPEVCMEHLEKYERENHNPFMVFGSIKPEIITPEMAQLTVRLEPSCIQFVPDRMKTPEMCAKAVEKDWMNMRFIPENMKTETLCKIAINRSIHAQQLVPNRLKTPELYMYPMKVNGLNLQFVPEKYRTPEVCLQAVKSNPDAVDFVPERFNNPVNIYEFYHGKLTDKLLTVKQLNYEQVQKIYNGESVKVSGMNFLGATLRDFTIDYDRKANQINLKAVDEAPEKKQKKQIEHQSVKRKGVKM